MALIGWSSPPDESLWDTLTNDDDLWVGQEVDVYLIVGVPGSSRPRCRPRRGTKRACSARSQDLGIGIISSDVMRAIAYKWRAFGQVTWIASCVSSPYSSSSSAACARV